MGSRQRRLRHTFGNTVVPVPVRLSEGLEVVHALWDERRMPRGETVQRFVDASAFLQQFADGKGGECALAPRADSFHIVKSMKRHD